MPDQEVKSASIVEKTIFSFFNTLAKEAIKKILTTITSLVSMWSFHAIMKISQKEGYRMIKEISDTYNVKAADWIPWVATVINSITGTKLDPALLIKGSSEEATRAMLVEFSNTVLKQVIGLVGAEKPMDEKTALAAAGNFLSINADFQFRGWLLHLLGDVSSFGMFKSLKDLPLAVASTFGLGWMGWLVMGVPVGEAMVPGLKWVYKRYLRNWRMTAAEATILKRKGKIDDTTWNEALEREGVRDSDKLNFYNLNTKDFRDASIQRLFVDGFFSRERADNDLRDKQYSDAQRKVLLDYWQWDARRDVYQKLYNEFVDAYVEGRVAREALLPYAAALWTDTTIRDVQLSIADMKKAKVKVLSVTDLFAALAKKVLGLAEVRGRLLNMGYSTEDADILIRTKTAD